MLKSYFASRFAGYGFSHVLSFVFSLVFTAIGTGFFVALGGAMFGYQPSFLVIAIAAFVGTAAECHYHFENFRPRLMDDTPMTGIGSQAMFALLSMVLVFIIWLPAWLNGKQAAGVPVQTNAEVIYGLALASVCYFLYIRVWRKQFGRTEKQAEVSATPATN